MASLELGIDPNNRKPQPDEIGWIKMLLEASPALICRFWSRYRYKSAVPLWLKEEVFEERTEWVIAFAGELVKVVYLGDHILDLKEPLRAV